MAMRICCFLLLLTILGCTSGATKDYAYALERDDLVSWERFLRRNPRSEHADQAKARIEALKRIAEQEAEALELADWEAARDSHSIHAYVLYLRQHPEDKHSNEAEELLFSMIDHRVQEITQGDPSRIRAGEEFPIEKLRLEAHIAALGAQYVSRSSSSTGDLSHYQLFYPLNGKAGATESEEIIYFTRTNAKLGLSVQGTQQETTASILGNEKPKTTVHSKRIVGNGFAILTVDGVAAVYEFE